MKRFGKLTGETLKRVPTGFAPDHPMAEYLKMKQFFCGTTVDESSITREKFLAEAAGIFQVATPFVRFLNEAIM